MISSEIVEKLRDPATYPDSTTAVEVIETHISWVFLTDHFAYKLKKPVHFEFLDFSSQSARRAACEQEVRLNRRLAADVYLDVVPVTRDVGQGIELAGQGPEIDSVVRMRRLPAACSLDNLIHQGAILTALERTMIDYLVDFYLHLPPADVDPAKHHQQLLEHCQANLVDLSPRLDNGQHTALRRICGAQQRFLLLERDLILERVANGHVVDGHGDLRAEHVYLEPSPKVIDCLEFSAELRRADVVDELSFLGLDCEMLGHHEIGNELLTAYRDASDDQYNPALESFYKCYRATVRAKVAMLRAEQLPRAGGRADLRHAHDCFAWADHYAQQLGPPAFIVVGGLMGTGKSTLARALAAAIDAEHLFTDGIRRAMFGDSPSPAEYGGDTYVARKRRRVYDSLLAQAQQILDQGRSVVVDGTFLTNELRSAAIACGQTHGALSLFVECHCPPQIARQRLATRGGQDAYASEARPELYGMQLEEREIPISSLPLISLDTTDTTEDEVQAVVRELRERTLSA